MQEVVFDMRDAGVRRALMLQNRGPSLPLAIDFDTLVCTDI